MNENNYCTFITNRSDESAGAASEIPRVSSRAGQKKHADTVKTFISQIETVPQDIFRIFGLLASQGGFLPGAKENRERSPDVRVFVLHRKAPPEVKRVVDVKYGGRGVGRLTGLRARKKAFFPSENGENPLRKRGDLIVLGRRSPWSLCMQRAFGRP